MKTLIAALALLGALSACPTAMAADPVTLRAYPGQAVHSYPMESLRGVQGLMLQNLAVINSAGAPEEITAVDLELMANGEVVDVRHLVGPALDRIAASGAQIKASGMMDFFAFQFGDVLGTPAAGLAASHLLAPGQALLITQQVFAWKGGRDALRITVHAAVGAKPVQARMTLPIMGLGEPRYTFPLEGRWYIGAGPTFHTAHRWATPEEFALDIIAIGDGGLSHRGAGDKRGDYYAYGATVRAAGEGEVVAVVSGEPEDDSWFRKPGEGLDAFGARVQDMQAGLFAKGAVHSAGNYVMIRHPWGEYSLYAHLQPGSALVKVGDHVAASQPIARLGTTGGSTEPHLHFQVCDGPEPLGCAGLPIAFKDLEVPNADYPRPVQSGDFVVSH